MLLPPFGRYSSPASNNLIYKIFANGSGGIGGKVYFNHNLLLRGKFRQVDIFT